MSENEKWTKEDVEDFYFVYADGSVESIAYNWRGYGRRILRHTINSHGYPSVRISIHGVRRHITVHRLVAMFYLPSRPSPIHEIRHLDGNKLNCSAINLSWGTRRDNALDRNAHNRTVRGEKHPRAVVTAKAVKAIRNAPSTMSGADLATKYGITREQVNNIRAKRSWKHV